jgi:hypothetical protein
MSFVGDLSKARRLNEVYEKQIAELEKRNRRDMFIAAALTGLTSALLARKDGADTFYSLALDAVRQADVLIDLLDSEQEGGETC